ncbi:hypothetical protein ACT29H_01025 [Thermophagus sp. OGC60D27]|uniref:hypothetical protein n=1 Tax=Thermophagus sp. OGC60D27 TaxID=3458415 RepID=UPI0040384CA7
MMKKNGTWISVIILIFLGLNSCQNSEELDHSSWVVMDMVHNNPGEGFTKTEFNEPSKLREYGFNAQVVNEFQSVHCAISFNSLNENIFPEGSKERIWIDSLANRITKRIDEIHQEGLEAYYFMDIIVLPRRLVQLYKDEICDSTGRIDFTRPKTQEIHRIMLDEVFERFPGLDGLVIRVGETYLQNVPYHTGNGPILRDEKSWMHNTDSKSDGGEEIHRLLIDLLRDEVCEKFNKKIFYRTWDFGFFHVLPEYYLSVTDSIDPHPNLYFSVKYVKGDYHRTLKFNPTLGIGKHKQIVEVQCQREYEGKGAYPNYIAKGVIDGFEELQNDTEIHSLNGLKTNPNFAGVWTWSRGGGWVGPYISNELWCDLNAYCLSQWANNPNRPEKEIFGDYARMRGFEGENIRRFHRLALLSADAIVRGRASLIMPINLWWTRDEFIGGENELTNDFKEIIQNGLVEEMLDEKGTSVDIWQEMVAMADSLKGSDTQTLHYIRTSTRYGSLLYAIYEQAWIIMLKGQVGESSGNYDYHAISSAIEKYDLLWKEFIILKEQNPDCATLYRPFAFNYGNPPTYFGVEGLKKTVDRYRNLTAKIEALTNK